MSVAHSHIGMALRKRKRKEHRCKAPCYRNEGDKVYVLKSHRQRKKIQMSLCCVVNSSQQQGRSLRGEKTHIYNRAVANTLLKSTWNITAQILGGPRSGCN